MDWLGSLVFVCGIDHEFRGAFDFFREAMIGYGGKTIAVVGGAIGLALSGMTGRMSFAIIGIIIAIVAALAFPIMDAIYGFSGSGSVGGSGPVCGNGRC